MLDVIVIGCGASGVAALRKLHDAGLKVLGLEAQDRIGGRICAQAFGNGVVDVGAAWCHGEKDNLVFELANPLGLLGRPAPDNKWFVVSNGDLVPNDKSEEILRALNDAVVRADKNNTKSISECVRSASKSSGILTKNPTLTRQFVEWYERNNHVGGQRDLKKGKSLRGLEEGWPCEGDAMINWKGRGFKTILDVLLNRYPDPSKEIPVQIMLNKEVESIRWRTASGAADHNPLVHVKTSDGSLYAARSVIVTISVGVLKERHSQLFNPPLPAEKVTTINTLQMVVLDKIYVKFSKPWWPKTPANFTLLWREEDKAKLSERDSWISHVFGLQTVDYQPDVLLAWIYGDGAELMEEVSEEGVVDGINKILELFMAEFDVAPVNSILRSRWASNSLARGAYAYRSVATEETGGSALTLSEPLYHGHAPVVCFAGEATSYHRHGAVHGAVDAGFREAERLIECFKKL